MNYENMRENTVSMLSKAKQSHNCILSNNFKFYISQFFRTFNFLSVFFNFEKTLSLRGFAKKRSNPICLDCHARQRRAFSLALNDSENNFAIINLVKSFLTSITFDSLSRKIKIPCLVINKNFFIKEYFQL